MSFEQKNSKHVRVIPLSVSQNCTSLLRKIWLASYADYSVFAKAHQQLPTAIESKIWLAKFQLVTKTVLAPIQCFMPITAFYPY